MNVMAWADRHIERFGDFEAVVDGDRVWSSCAVHDSSCRLASGLIEAGVEPGARILVWLPSSADLVIAFSAILRAGAASVDYHRQ